MTGAYNYIFLDQIKGRDMAVMLATSPDDPMLTGSLLEVNNAATARAGEVIGQLTRFTAEVTITAEKVNTNKGITITGNAEILNNTAKEVREVNAVIKVISRLVVVLKEV